MKSGLKILRLPIGSTIQDHGRFGYRRYGVTRGGAMDIFALAEGQALLGNSRTAAALEMTGPGGKFESVGQNLVAFSGAEMELLVNGKSYGWRRTVRLQERDVLEIGANIDGSYSYLHLPGGIESPLVLGSQSAHAQAELGWSPSEGEHLFTLNGNWKDMNLCLPKPNYFFERKIRIIRGPQSNLFDKKDFQSLERAEFQISNSRNRVGVRVHCSTGAFNADLGTTISSDAIVAGDIQVAADGIPAILLADFQPVGGYPRIATVISADIHKVAQMPVGTVFRFELTDRSKALSELAELRSNIADLPSKVTPTIRNPEEISDLLSYTLIDGVITGEEKSEN